MLVSALIQRLKVELNERQLSFVRIGSHSEGLFGGWGCKQLQAPCVSKVPFT